MKQAHDNHVLPSAVLVLEHLGAKSVVSLNATEPVVPGVPRQLGELKLMTGLGKILALVGQYGAFGKLSDGQLGAVAPSPLWRPPRSILQHRGSR